MTADENLRKLRDASDAASSVDTTYLSGDEALILKQAVAQINLVHDAVENRAESELFDSRADEWPGGQTPILGGVVGGGR